ncbi:hypothetical protein Tco_1006349 [Tanacetum coccineum]|uniref:Uncharacterized protein n=1 Tax=Tanacetum coccineum TaxID=301880 RepID=A0ABQ5FHM4_9ASTR
MDVCNSTSVFHSLSRHHGTNNKCSVVHPNDIVSPKENMIYNGCTRRLNFDKCNVHHESKNSDEYHKDNSFMILGICASHHSYIRSIWYNSGIHLKEDGSKYRFTFMLDKKMLSLTLDDFRTIFHLPQATDNNHDSFVPPSFLDMVPFYKNELGFTIELKTSSSFKTTGLLQPWQTLCKIFSKCFDNTHNWMRSTTVVDNANDVLLYQ